jgi:hypothetical protein
LKLPKGPLKLVEDGVPAGTSPEQHSVKLCSSGAVGNTKLVVFSADFD